MPLFDWDSPDPASVYCRSFWGPRLLVYMAVTVPLTFFTFTVWSLWLYVRYVRRRRRQDEARIHLNRGVIRPEVSVLAKRDMSIPDS